MTAAAVLSRALPRIVALVDALEVGDADLAICIACDLERDFRDWLQRERAA